MMILVIRIVTESKIAIGTVQFGTNYGVSNKSGVTPVTEVKKIINLAQENNIKYFDTAPVYGESEQVLGKCLNNYGEIITKTISIKNKVISEADIVNIRSEFNRSLKRIKRDSVYALLVHNSNDLTKKGSERLHDELCSLKDEGKIKKIGLSAYTSDDVDSVISRYEIDLIQLPVNLFDQRLIHNGYLKSISEKGIEIHARSVFLQGLLLMPLNSIPAYFNKYKKQLDNYRQCAKQCGLTLLQASFGFVHSLKQINNLIVGVTNSNELKEIVLASNENIEFEQFFDLAIADPQLINPSLWKL